LGLLIARWRRTDALGALEPWDIEIVAGQEEVLGAGLGENGLTVRLGVTDAQCRAGVADVDEKNGRAGDERRDGNGAVRCLGFQNGWS